MSEVLTEVLGNMHDPEWHHRLHHAQVDPIVLDQWTAQKSRFLGVSAEGKEYAIALKRHTHINDGDIVKYDPETQQAVVLRLALNPVLVIDMKALEAMPPKDIVRISVELGHALGNQHWPAVVKGTKVYVPLTVDKKVMLSVMETHNIDGITYEFESGTEVIPYLAPDEVRRLFGGAGHENHEINPENHEHIHAQIVH